MYVLEREEGDPRAPKTRAEAMKEYFRIMRFCKACGYINDKNPWKHWGSHFNGEDGVILIAAGCAEEYPCFLVRFGEELLLAPCYTNWLEMENILDWKPVGHSKSNFDYKYWSEIVNSVVPDSANDQNFLKLVVKKGNFKEKLVKNVVREMNKQGRKSYTIPASLTCG